MGAVKNAMQRDGLDPDIMDLDPEKSVASQLKKDEDEEDDGPPLKEDPQYQKYFKMLKMVRNTLFPCLFTIIYSSPYLSSTSKYLGFANGSCPECSST